MAEDRQHLNRLSPSAKRKPLAPLSPARLPSSAAASSSKRTKKAQAAAEPADPPPPTAAQLAAAYESAPVPSASINFATGQPADVPVHWHTEKGGKDSAQNRGLSAVWRCFRYGGTAPLLFKAGTAEFGQGGAQQVQRARNGLRGLAKTVKAITASEHSRRHGQFTERCWDGRGEPPSRGLIQSCSLLGAVRQRLLVPVHDEAMEAAGGAGGAPVEQRDPFAFLEVLQSYVSIDGPWKCPLMRAVIAPGEASVAVDADGDTLLRVHVRVYFCRLLFFLIADNSLKTIFDHFERAGAPPALGHAGQPLREAPTMPLTRPRQYPRLYKSHGGGGGGGGGAASASASLAYSTSPAGLLKAAEHGGYRAAAQPPGLALALKDYQLQALAWMQDRESLPALGLGIVPGSMLGAACTQGRGEPR